MIALFAIFVKSNKINELNERAYQKKLKAKLKKRKPKPRKYKYDLTKRKIEHWKSYADYCKSEAFHIWKMAILSKYKYRCQFCGKKAETAHHTNYRSWGTETIKDGIAACNKCHKCYHYNEPWWHKEAG